MLDKAPSEKDLLRPNLWLYGQLCKIMWLSLFDRYYWVDGLSVLKSLVIFLAVLVGKLIITALAPIMALPAMFELARKNRGAKKRNLIRKREARHRQRARTTEATHTRTTAQTK